MFLSICGKILFLLLAIASIVSAVGPTVTITYTGVPITRQTSTRVLSIEITFGDQDPSQVYALYAVGYSGSGGSPTDFLNWTLASNPTNASTLHVTPTFADPLPADLSIYATIQTYYYDNNTLIGTYSSGSIVVGDRVPSDASCPNIWNPVGTDTSTPPAPTTTIVYNSTTQTFDFTVAAAYLLQEWTWIIDLAPFTNDYTKGNMGLGVTNCENHNGTVIGTRNFAELFNAAPASDANTGGGPALNNQNFLAYEHTDSGWSVTSPSCAQITYTRSFSFSQILNCKRFDNQSSISVSNNGNEITYSGTLHVTAVKPTNSLDMTQNFRFVEFQFPWSFSFSVTSMSIGTAVDTPLLTYVVNEVKLVGAGNLYIKMTTNTQDVEYKLTYNSVTAPPGVTDLNLLSVDNSSSSVQTWQFQTASVANSYSGNYTFSFTRSLISNGSNALTVTAPVTIQMSVNNLQTGPNSSFATTVEFYGDNSFTAGQEKSVFTQIDTIYVLTYINLANPADINTYDISTRDVWLCYTTNNQPPVYDGVNNFGCQVQTLTVRPIAQIISNGAQTSGPLASQFVINFYDPITANPNRGTSSAGFSFTAAPLVAVRGYGKFFVQVRSSIAMSGGKRRSVMSISEINQSVSLQNSFGGADLIDTSTPATPPTQPPTQQLPPPPTPVPMNSPPTSSLSSLASVNCVSLSLLYIFVFVASLFF